MVYETIGLDFSGTIADDRTKVHQTMNDVLRSYNKPEIDFDTWVSIMSLDFKSMWQDLGVSASLDEIQDRYREFYPHNHGPFLIPGNSDALSKLSQRIGRNNIYVVSGGNQEILEDHLDKLKIGNYIGRVLGGAYNKAEVLRFFPRKTTLYVGDMEQDAIAARQVGMDFVAIDHEYAYHNINRLIQYNPRYIINHLGNLLNIINNGR